MFPAIDVIKLMSVQNLLMSLSVATSDQVFLSMSSSQNRLIWCITGLD